MDSDIKVGSLVRVVSGRLNGSLGLLIEDLGLCDEIFRGNWIAILIDGIRYHLLDVDIEEIGCETV